MRTGPAWESCRARGAAEARRGMVSGSFMNHCSGCAAPCNFSGGNHAAFNECLPLVGCGWAGALWGETGGVWEGRLLALKAFCGLFGAMVEGGHPPQGPRSPEPPFSSLPFPVQILGEERLGKEREGKWPVPHCCVSTGGER